MAQKYWKGVVIEDTEDFMKFEGLYSVFSAVEIFLYSRDFLDYFGLMDVFYLSLRDLQLATRSTGNMYNWQHVQLATRSIDNMCN